MRPVRFIALLLALLLAFPLTLFAAQPVADEEDTEPRFLFSSLTGTSGTAYETTDDASVILDVGKDTSFSADAAAALSRGESNTLYISLINASNATALRLTYKYFDHTPKTDTVEHALTPNAAAAEVLLLETPYIEMITSLTLTFVGATEGTIELQALYNISSYQNDFEEQAVIERCAYVPETATLEIWGTVDYATVVRYHRETLALFAIAPGEGVYLINKIPVARTGMSLSFEFSVPVSYKEELAYRYVVAVVERTGERIPLTDPYYPVIPAAESLPSFGFKGLHTAQMGTVAESGAALTFVDIYLDRMDGTQTDGVLYAGDHSYYYFDTDYVEQLDARIRTLTDSGARVCLRLLVSGNVNGISFADYTDSDNTFAYKALTVTSQEGLREVLAMVDFLTARYAGGDVGRVDAIAIGRAVNQTAEQTYTSAVDLAEYTEHYVTALALVYGMAVRNLPDVRMVLPLSDVRMDDHLREDYVRGNYPVDMFLYSFATALSDMYLVCPPITVMLESAATPARLTGQQGNGYVVDDLTALRTYWGKITSDFPFIQEKIWYNWMPNAALPEGVLTAAYMLYYISLQRSGLVETFTTDITVGNDAVADTLLYAVYYIDTNLFSVAAGPALRQLSISSFSELFPDFSEDTLFSRTVHALSLTKGGYAGGKTPLGSYALWNFSAPGGALEWYTGSEDGEISVLSVGGVGSLTAAFATSENYQTLVHRISNSAFFSFAPLLAITAGVRGEEDVPYEIRVQLYGTNTVVTASAAVTSGETNTLYLDLTDVAADLSSVTGIRISARSLDGREHPLTLVVQSVLLESAELDTAALAERISALLNNGETEEEDARQHNWLSLIVTLLVVFASIGIVALLITKYHMDATKN